jgi:hypothetical protein
MKISFGLKTIASIIAGAIIGTAMFAWAAPSTFVTLIDSTGALFGTASNPLTFNCGSGCSSSSSPITPVVSGALESNHVLKNAAGTLISLNISPTVDGYLMVFNATSAPADGAVTPTLCIPVAAGQVSALQWAVGETYSTGITAVMSTTGCFTKTASATAFFHAQVL